MDRSTWTTVGVVAEDIARGDTKVFPRNEKLSTRYLLVRNDVPCAGITKQKPFMIFKQPH